jgi:pimeloyl-ACP methyl ester carboxylesterase
VITPLTGAVIVAMVGASVVLAMDRLALRLIRPPQQPHRRTVGKLPFSSKPHSFSASGQPLTGHLIEPDTDGGGAVAVLVHGWGSSHGNLIRLAVPILRGGHPVLLFDVRHHGESPPSRFVTARHYRDDIKAACQEMEQLYPGRAVAVVGHSMGGSCGILAAVAGAPIQGLISISAPADLWEVWAYYFDRQGLPGKWIVRLLNPFWRRRAGASWESLDPESRAKELALPFLVLHGARDESVPVAHANVLASAAGTEAVVMEGKDHSNLLDAPELHERVISFLSGLTH